MKKILSLLFIGILILSFGCETDSTDINQDGATGTIAIQAFDAPFQGDVEHIYLNIIEVSVHKASADSSEESEEEWLILSDTDTTIDFLELVNGQMASLLEENLEVGQYSQLRLLLGDSSAIVVDGTSYELKVPSGTQSGVKLNLGFDIAADEIIEIFLDFDAARSINKHPRRDEYSMTPTFKVFKSILSGTIAGTVTDSSGTGLEDIVINAVVGNDSTATITDNTGNYQFILLEGTYDISAQGYNMTSDTTYSSVSLPAGNNLTDFDFTLTE